MRLNAGIIFEHIRSSFDAELRGKAQNALRLSRPVFYMDSQTTFLANHLYLASADHLPAHPIIRDGVTIVCISDSSQLYRYVSRCTVIQIKGHPDFFSVYLAIQEVFDIYDAWNDRLFELFRSDADIQKIVALSSATFAEPLMVIDCNFHILASSGNVGEKSSGLWKDDSEQLSQYSIGSYLSSNELHTDIREPLFLKNAETNALCVNLFDRQDSFIGCLCILTTNDKPREGFDALASYLARIIETSIEKNPAVLSTEHAAREGVLRDLIDGKPIGPNQRWLLEEGSDERRYACVTLHAFDQEQTLPTTFICNSFKMAFRNSYALPGQSRIVGIIELAPLGENENEQRQHIGDTLASLNRSLNLTAGLSYGFSNLYDTPTYIRQAEAALENGSLMNPGESLYFFADYVLIEMVVNSLAGSPIESLIPEGLEKVMAHDAKSSISYLETLRAFLADNMNYSRVASKLFIHRSTLIDRIKKMEENYGIDLHDPDSRLHLQLILKAMEIGDAFKRGL